MDDKFEMYDLKVEVVEGDKPMVCSHKAGDYFLVEGENLVQIEKVNDIVKEYDKNNIRT